MATHQSTSDGNGKIASLERDVLDEYTRLLGNLNRLNETIVSLTSHTELPNTTTTSTNLSSTAAPSNVVLPSHLSTAPAQSSGAAGAATMAPMLTTTTAAAVLESLRALERKTTVVCTLLKASVYSIVLQQEVYSGSMGTAGEDGDGDE